MLHDPGYNTSTEVLTPIAFGSELSHDSIFCVYCKSVGILHDRGIYIPDFKVKTSK